MTGMEAWSIAAPILAMHMRDHKGGLNMMDEAYIVIFGALKELDERRCGDEEEHESKKGRA